MNTLFAALCVLPAISAMYIANGYGMMDYDRPDQKYMAKNQFGQLQMYDVSYDTQYSMDNYGRIRRYNVMDLSTDTPDYYDGFYGGLRTAPAVRTAPSVSVRTVPAVRAAVRTAPTVRTVPAAAANLVQQMQPMRSMWPMPAQRGAYPYRNNNYNYYDMDMPDRAYGGRYTS